MVAYFEATRDPEGGAAIALDEGEASVLRTLARQLLELIGPEQGPADGGDDPLAALFTEGPSEPPKDPALARLFPDAYGEPGQDQDDEVRRQAAEFRRFTETDLRTRKREDLLAMVRGLDEAGRAAEGDSPAVLTLGPEDARRWLGALNDLRLTIAVRLDIKDDDAAEAMLDFPAGDPNRPIVLAYVWLGGLQDSLIGTLLP
ncbi:DUF2017 domain-containing protein [Streptomyces hainanensis]|uniref:DUF2017 domain-containing protein n=1 Tax=Streptomyces hainanensis TaxID=402648 RepID=A0A4R4SLG9_9ACTN|nr:DUF2017 domain-containing protein [Streptomyces hainanensis]TDC64590.1 DUF2017 domain-containing protein [Streptomyces hainanensis]